MAWAAAIAPFRPLSDGAWRDAWCRLIAGAYRDERAEHGCPER